MRQRSRTVKLPKVTVKRVSSEKELAQAYAIRMRVFVEEQGVPREIELDDDDHKAMHFIAIVGSRVVGTARVLWHRGAAKIGRMAVLKSYRRRGVGTKLLRRAILAARRMSARKIYLHAQVAVAGFYQRMNFLSVGPVFDEAGIAHRKMILRELMLARPHGSKPPVKKQPPTKANKVSVV